MRNADTTSVPWQRSRRGELRRTLSASAPSAIVAAELAIMFFGATLPTPLYPLYRLVFGFGPTTLTLIYAVYVLGNLVALLFFGRLSDQIGRRSATLPAIGVGLLSTLAFLLADGTVWLFIARILSGLRPALPREPPPPGLPNSSRKATRRSPLQ